MLQKMKLVSQVAEDYNFIMEIKPKISTNPINNKYMDTMVDKIIINMVIIMVIKIHTTFKIIHMVKYSKQVHGHNTVTINISLNNNTKTIKIKIITNTVIQIKLLSITRIIITLKPIKMIIIIKLIRIIITLKIPSKIQSTRITNNQLILNKNKTNKNQNKILEMK